MDPTQLALTIRVIEEFMASPECTVPPETRQALEDLVEFVKFVHLAGGLDILPEPSGGAG